jgi:integrase-like protein
MRATSNNADGARLRALIIVLWRAGLRISEALDLAETDLDRARGALTVRRGKGGRRRDVGMDRWAWDQLTPYLEVRATLPVGALFCVIHGPTAGRRWEASAARKQLRLTAEAAGVRRRFAPHQLRHAHAAELAHKGVPLVTIQRQLGHCNLGVTSIYLQGIDNAEIIETVHSRPAPVTQPHPACTPPGRNGAVICRGRPRAPAGHQPCVHLRAGARTRCRAPPQVANLRTATAAGDRSCFRDSAGIPSGACRRSQAWQRARQSARPVTTPRGKGGVRATLGSRHGQPARASANR